MASEPKKHGKSPAYYAWQRLRKNRNAFISLGFIGICLVIALGGYLFLPDSSPNANSQSLELELLPPQSKVTILQIPKKEVQPRTSFLSFIISGKIPAYDEIPVKSYTEDKDSIRIIPFEGGAQQSFAIAGLKIVNRTYW